jgi:hypothetical protein
MILPLAMVGVLVWNALGTEGYARVFFATTIVPAVCLALSAVFWFATTRRLLHPADFGSGGNDGGHPDDSERPLQSRSNPPAVQSHRPAGHRRLIRESTREIAIYHLPMRGVCDPTTGREVDEPWSTTSHV